MISKSKLSKSKHSILILCRRLPNPKTSSGELRFWHIINILCKCSNNVTLLAEESANFDLFPSAQILTHRSLKAASKTIDVAVLEFWYMYPYIPALKKLNIPVIIDSVDVEYLRFERAQELLGLQYKHLRARKIKERLAYRMADAVWAVTENDARLIEKDCSNVTIVPNIHQLRSDHLGFNKRSGVIFVGSFRHKPNVDGLRWYKQYVLPLVSDLPHTIIGSDAPADIRRMPGFIGWVNESTNFVMKARVSIAPLRYGAGMKGKIGEAFSCATPVVSTRIGAEGYKIRNGIHFKLGSNPKIFAAAIRKLYNSEAIWKKMSNNCKKVVSGQTPAVIKKVIEKSLLQIIER